MNYDPELVALLSQLWSNDACGGTLSPRWSGAALSRPTLNR